MCCTTDLFHIFIFITAEEISVVQKEVDEMFKGRVLVGHAITNDEKVMSMIVPHCHKLFVGSWR
mgnify:CR=1 FL=1